MTHVPPVPGGFTREEWEAARPWPAYLQGVEAHREIWTAHVRRSALEEEAVARLESLPAPRRVLVLTGDWCGDAARTVPVLATACDAAPDVEARYLDLGDRPDAITRFLTHGGRAIPMAIVQDEAGAFLGAWGPRPAPLQALMRAQKRHLGPPTPETKAAWYAPLLGWYGRDRGRTTVEELLMLLERGGPSR